jgi:hypothetical protein
MHKHAAPSIKTTEVYLAVMKTTLETSQRPVNSPDVNSAHSSDQLLEKARADTSTVLKELESRLSGLSAAEAEARVNQYGLNEIAR